MSYKMEITEDEQQAVADVTNYHQGWTHGTSDSDHQEHLTILIASGKQRKWFDKI